MLKPYSTLRKLCASAGMLVVLGLSLAACSTTGTGTGNGGTTPTPASTSTSATATPTQPASAPTNPFKVASVAMSVSPASIAGQACGSTITVTYSATFNVLPNGPGGTAQFLYTTDNGRGTPSASLSFAAGQASKVFTFTWQGALEPDNVAPGLGGVIVTSPNQLTSSLVRPTGTCTATPTAPFKITSINVTASPASLNVACGTQVTETYTATFHIAANSPGGTIVFTYTTNNGRSNSQDTNLSVGAGQTTATYTFTWQATVENGGPYPGVGIVLATQPNNIESNDAVPSVTCH